MSVLGYPDLNKKEFHIYGAGIAGLLVGYYLKKHRIPFILFEKSDRAGGKIATRKTPYGLVESATNAVFTSEDAVELLNELDLVAIAATKKLRRRIIRKGLRPSSPIQLKDILTILFGLFKKIPPEASGELSTVREFLVPLAGEKFVDEVVSSGLRGVYASDAKNLHSWSILKLRPRQEQRYLGFLRQLIRERKKKRGKHRPQSVSFAGGMQNLIERLTSELKEHIQYQPPGQVSKEVNNLFCTDAHSAANLFKDSPELAEKLQQVRYVSVNSTTVFSKQRVAMLEHSFGVVCSPHSKMLSMGILNNSAIFPQRTFDPNIFSYTFISPGNIQEEEILQQDLANLGVSTKHVVATFTKHWRQGIPHYTPAHWKLLQDMREQLARPHQHGYMIFGNYAGGISIREMISSAKNFAGQLAEKLEGDDFSEKSSHLQSTYSGDGDAPRDNHIVQKTK